MPPCTMSHKFSFIWQGATFDYKQGNERHASISSICRSKWLGKNWNMYWSRNHPKLGVLDMAEHTTHGQVSNLTTHVIWSWMGPMVKQPTPRDQGGSEALLSESIHSKPIACSNQQKCNVHQYTQISEEFIFLSHFYNLGELQFTMVTLL